MDLNDFKNPSIIATVIALIPLWISFLISLLSKDESDRDDARRVFFGCFLTVVLLSFVIWFLYTYAPIHINGE